MFLTKPEFYYKSCSVDYWRYKTAVLASAIMNYEMVKPLIEEVADDINDEDCLTALKLDLHFTYFQAVETLFSMIFALYRKKIDNRKLWIYLTHLSTPKSARDLFARIKKIAQGETEMFDVTTTAGPNLDMPFVRYLFFFGGSFSVEEEAMKRSLESIKKALVLMASNFVDRDEYNAYKHSFRFVTSQGQRLEMINPKEGKTVATWKIPNAVTYLRFSENGEASQVSKAWDWERDCRMTHLAQALIYNIIVSRRRYYFKEDKVRLNFFADLDLKETSKMDSDASHFTLNIKPLE